MNDIAHKVAERLYGNDKVKFEIIFHFLNDIKKFNDMLDTQDFDEFTKSLFEGSLDRYMMGMIECVEDYFDLKELTVEMRKRADHIPDINMRVFKKVVEICEYENALHLADVKKLDKNSVKKVLKRVWEMNE